MIANGLVHQDDGGRVVLFATGTELLLACDKGHWWMVNASSEGSVKGEPGGPLSRLDHLRDAFGAQALEVMGLHE